MTPNPNMKTVCDNCSAQYIVKHDLPEDDYIEQFNAFIKQGEVPNLILSGGPGVGKTTLARAVLEQLGRDGHRRAGNEGVGLLILERLLLRLDRGRARLPTVLGERAVAGALDERAGGGVVGACRGARRPHAPRAYRGSEAPRSAQ